MENNGTTAPPDVVTYYEATRRDFRMLWTGKEDLAVHFGYYDQMARSHSAALLRMNAVLAESVGVSAHDRVLDAGCGYGGSAMWLAREFGCEVTGLTLVPFQAREGNQRVAQRHLTDKVRLLQADYAHLPFADQAFSLVWALESLVHAVDRSAVFTEARRVLAPGGRLVLTDCVLPTNPALSAQDLEALKAGLGAWAMPDLLNACDYQSALTAAGFRIIQWQDITAQIAPSVQRLGRLCRIAAPGARLLHALGLFDARRLRNVLGSNQQAQMFKRGWWRYVLASVEAV